MTEFTPFASFIGGAIIGLSAFTLLYYIGKIAGVSGILNGSLSRISTEQSWRAAFVVGLIASPFIAIQFGAQLPDNIDTSWTVLIIGAFLVGFGTCLGNGCTSGHGICGIGRFSKRSIIATCTFMLFAAIAVYLVNYFNGTFS